MNKKIIIIICVILLLIGGGLIIYNQNHINVRGTTFTIPEGYHAIDENVSINVTDGVESIIIAKEVPDNNLNKSIERYVKSKEKLNGSVEITNFYVKDIKVYKGDVLNTDTAYYWFMKNDNLYWMYSWSASEKTDSLAYELIRSTESVI